MTSLYHPCVLERFDVLAFSRCSVFDAADRALSARDPTKFEETAASLPCSNARISLAVLDVEQKCLLSSLLVLGSVGLSDVDEQVVLAKAHWHWVCGRVGRTLAGRSAA